HCLQEARALEGGRLPRRRTVLRRRSHPAHVSRAFERRGGRRLHVPARNPPPQPLGISSAGVQCFPELSPFSVGPQNCHIPEVNKAAPMRPSTLARFGLLLAVIPASSFLAACGGGGSSKKVDVDDWVSDLLDASSDFCKSSDKAGETFGDADLDDTKAAKAAFKKSLDAQKKAQKEFRSDFDKIGQPDIEDGDKVVKAFQDEFKAHDKQTEDVGKAVADIDDDDNFTDAFFDIADKFDVPDFREKLTAIADDSDSSDVQDLIDQIDADSDCS